jgi:hypothetical protein
MNCVRCKKKINPNIAVCPYCGAVNGQQGQNHSSKEQPRVKDRKKMAIILTIVLCACALLTFALILILGGRSGSSSGGGSGSSGGSGGVFEKSSTTDEAEETVDAGTYYQEIGDVISITGADGSEKVPTEGEVRKILTDRGFDRYEITTGYSISGEYLGDKPIGDTGTKHPLYETYFMSESGMLWSVEVIDGSLFAYPASYNLESGKDVLAIVSEKDSIIGYDSETNQYFEYVPKKTAAVVIKVETIDAEHLNQLTKEEIDKYVN